MSASDVAMTWGVSLTSDRSCRIATRGRYERVTRDFRNLAVQKWTDRVQKGAAPTECG